MMDRQKTGAEGARGCGWARLAFFVLAGALALQAGLLFPAAAAAPPEQLLEDLQYRVNAWVLGGAARAGITLKSLGGGRYRADLSVEPQGLLKIISGQRRDRFHTEMAFRDGRLVPLIYREETRKRGRRGLKEYRFDYEQGRLELWTYHEGKGMRHKWHTALKKEPIYDPLSAFYNFRLGAMGPPQEGETLKVSGIPYPQPEEITVRIGPQGQEGRKVMVSIINRVFDNEQGVIFVYFDEKWSPTQAWTRVLRVGKVEGIILPESKTLNRPLKEMLSAGEGKIAFQK
ncbi:MAG: DUF3108 domain-containing protein [Thermodesulfobacteriota bacterium]